MRRSLVPLVLAGLASGCTLLNPEDYNFRKEVEISREGHGWVELDSDIGIHYIRAGEKNERKVLLLHGLCMSNFTWRKTMPFLSGSFDVYAPDFVGFGFSDKPRDFDYSIKEFGEMTREFMDKKEIDHASVVGNSLGGGVGMYLAVNYPERVDSLVLVNSIGSKVNEPAGFDFLRLPFVSSFFENPRYVVWGINGLMHNSNTDEVETYRIPYESHDAWHALRETLRSGNPEEIVGSLIGRVEVPTLVVSGKYDPLVPSSSSEEIHLELEESRMLTLFSGHFPQEEVPEEFNKEVYDFIDKYSK